MKNRANSQASFLHEYEIYVRTVLKPAQQILKSIFQDWKKPDYWRPTVPDSHRPAPTPVQRAHTRVKRPESVLDKIYRKPKSYPSGLVTESIHKMHDTLGGRIIMYFISGFPIIDREINSHPEFEIVKDDPPVAYLDHQLLSRFGMSEMKTKAKASGYASIHYIVKVRVPELQPEQYPCAEIQVRTLAEDIWSEVEHLLGYKPNKRTSLAVSKQFAILSRQLAVIDEQFNFFYEELLHYQAESEIVSDDPLNAENLPAVLNQVGVGCAQREIDSLLKLLASRGIEKVRDLQEAASGNIVDIIRNTYRNHTGREPINFEIVACLAAIDQSEEHRDIEMAVRSQIDYLKGWEALKKEIR